jgi:amino-acid N-acetyltransferase
VKLTDLQGILQYVPQFREKTFVIAVDAGIVTDENFPNILLDVAVLPRHPVPAAAFALP